jgi:hypothetical protein
VTKPSQCAAMVGLRLVAPAPYTQMSRLETALTAATFTGNEVRCQPEAVKCATVSAPKSQVSAGPKVTAAVSSS